MPVLSLAQRFDAPNEFVGEFGWICGFSADAEFLDDAAERFTRLSWGQRAQQGRIALAMMLDPGCAPISLETVPGVAHLPYRGEKPRPFRLLHAKVALLGFRRVDPAGEWLLRLIVSTGNWTRHTLEQSLDLAWQIEVTGDGAEWKCADVRAAAAMFQWLRGYYDCRLLERETAGGYPETRGAMETVDRWVERCVRRASGPARFMDSRKKSLLAQLAVGIRAEGSAVARNYLAMGSGFYENTTEGGAALEVPQLIVNELRNEGLLTKSAEMDLYVNPRACQGIAGAVEALEAEGFQVRPAAVPVPVFGGGATRSLHAKFLFGANSREGHNACRNPWVYLGSGNLTKTGFKMGIPDGGNLEAGVVFAPESLFWDPAREVALGQVVKNLLPLQWDDLVPPGGDGLEAGAAMEEGGEPYVAAPIAWLEWHEEGGAGELRLPAGEEAEIAVLDTGERPCVRTATGYRWPEARPQMVEIRWDEGERKRDASIPVVDGYGRIAAAELPRLELEEIWLQLADFPLPPMEAGEEEEAEGVVRGLGEGTAGAMPAGSYPVRRMMELVEEVASRQTTVEAQDWGLWCNRLEQTMERARDCAGVAMFRELGLNPLSPLRAAPFRPEYAEDAAAEPGRMYEAALERVERVWGVAGLDELGGLG